MYSTINQLSSFLQPISSETQMSSSKSLDSRISNWMPRTPKSVLIGLGIMAFMAWGIAGFLFLTLFMINFVVITEAVSFVAGNPSPRNISLSLPQLSLPRFTGRQVPQHA